MGKTRYSTPKAGCFLGGESVFCGAPVLDAVGMLKGHALMRGVLFAVFLVAASATVSAADSYTDAVSAVHRDNYDLAARLFRPLAEQGHAGSQSFLGVLYANGQGVLQNYEDGRAVVSAGSGTGRRRGTVPSRCAVCRRVGRAAEL